MINEHLLIINEHLLMINENLLIINEYSLIINEHLLITNEHLFVIIFIDDKPRHNFAPLLPLHNAMYLLALYASYLTW